MRLLAAVAAAALVAGCAVLGPPLPEKAALARFSSAAPGGPLPPGWRAWRLSQFKRPTHYELVDADGRTALQATAEASASALVHEVDVDPREVSRLRWRWKVLRPVPGADPHQRHTEDAPVRVLVAFDGDRARLPLEDRLLFSQVKAITGQDLPYATLAYVWQAHLGEGTVIRSPHTGRVRMVVADSGEERIGAWRVLTRDVREDFRLAFGEEPGRIRWIGVLTDTDNTGERAKALYGDVELVRAAVVTGETARPARP